MQLNIELDKMPRPEEGGFSLFLAYLLANASALSAEDRIPTQQTGKEAIVSAFFPDVGWVDVS